MNTFPNEVIICIMKFLDIKDLYHLGSCAKQFFNLFKSNDIWKKRTIDDFPFTLNHVGHIDNISDLAYMNCYNLLNTLMKRINKYVSTEEADVSRLSFPGGGGHIKYPYVKGPPYKIFSYVSSGGSCLKGGFETIDVCNLAFQNRSGYLINGRYMDRDGANKYLREHNYREYNSEYPGFLVYEDDYNFGVKLGLFL